MVSINNLHNYLESNLKNAYQYATENNSILSKKEQAGIGGLAYTVAHELREKKQNSKITVNDILGYFNNCFNSIAGKIDEDKDGNLTEKEIELIEKYEDKTVDDFELSWDWNLKKAHEKIELCEPIKPDKMDLAWYYEFIKVLQNIYSKISSSESNEKDTIVKNELKKQRQEMEKICSEEFDILNKPAKSHIYVEPDKLKSWTELWKEFSKNLALDINSNQWSFSQYLKYNNIFKDLKDDLDWCFKEDVKSAPKVFFKPEELSYEWFSKLSSEEKNHICNLNNYLPNFSEDILYSEDPNIKKVAKNILGEEKYNEYYQRSYDMSYESASNSGIKFKVNKPKVSITGYSYKGKPWAYDICFGSSYEDKESGWTLDTDLILTVDRDGNFISEDVIVSD